jgi:hypothetical protein
MPKAGLVVRDATKDMRGLPAQVRHADPLDALIERVRPIAARSVDALQVAASLESSGVTDRAARVEFGYADVFDLAAEICRRVDRAAEPPRPGTSRRRATELRDVSHGALYLVPVLVFPAVFAVLGQRPLVPAFVLVGGFCWVWSGVTAWSAYRLLGEGRQRSMGALLRWSALAGLLLTVAGAAVGAIVTGAGAALIAMAAAQMAFQLAATILVLHRREGLLLVAMAPAAVAAVGYLAAGPRLLPVAVGTAAGAVALSFGVAVWQTFGGGGADRPLLPALRRQLRPGAAVLAFTALSAAYFLYPQARYLTERFDVTVAVLPVIAGMGVVEWRARRFGVDARALLVRVHHPRDFATRVRRLLLVGLGSCLLLVAALAAVLLSVLARTGRLSAAGAIMAAAGVALAGAYFLGFLLANMSRYGWLCGSLLLCLGAYAAGDALAGGGALGGTTAFLGATLLLLLLYLTALAGSVGDARRHR